MKKIILCCLALLCLCRNNTFAQQPLQIGDEVAPVTLNIIRPSQKQFQLQDLRGKLVIIDFWATWCKPCIALMPKMDSLQKVFSNDLQILPVTYESAEKVNKFFSKLPRLHNIALPIAANEATLHKLFPHQELPHYVWIDASGKVLAITESDAVNATNIARAIEGQRVNVVQKDDVVTPFNKEEPLLLGGNGGGAELSQYHRVFTGYIPGIQGGDNVFQPNEKHGGRLVSRNVSLPWLYQLAFSEGRRYFGNNHMVYEVKDKSKLVSDAKGAAYRQWLSQGNGFCYEIMVPPQMKGMQYKLMQEDLKVLFPQYSATVAVRDQPCLALVRTSGVDKLKTKGGPSSFRFDATGGELKNRSITMLVLQLNAQYLQHLRTPVVDQTNYTEKVDMKIDAELSNVKAIRNALIAYDLDLHEKTCPIEMIIIRDSQPPAPGSR